MAGYTACSDDQVLVQAVAPAAFSSSSPTGTWINFAGYKRAQIIINVGAVGSGESITATVKQATSSTGAGAKAMQNPIALNAAVTASNSAVVININGQSFDANNGFQWFALVPTFVNSGTVASAETVASYSVLADPNATPPTTGAGPITGSVASQVVGAGIQNDY